MSILMVLRGRTFPFIALALMLLFVVFQLISGAALNGKWEVWVTRQRKPRVYWTVMAIESALVLIGCWAASL